MKKTVALVLGLVLSFSFTAGSVFADSNLENTVDKLVGTPYRWAGTTAKGFDCSGFTQYVFHKFGIDLAHSSKAQASEGAKVSKSNLRAGDLVFFNTDGRGISHVGIYLGDGVFAHSANGKGVTKNRLSDSYYANRYVTAARVLDDDGYEQVAAN